MSENFGMKQGYDAAAGMAANALDAHDADRDADRGQVGPVQVEVTKGEAGGVGREARISVPGAEIKASYVNTDRRPVQVSTYEPTGSYTTGSVDRAGNMPEGLTVKRGDYEQLLTGDNARMAGRIVMGRAANRVQQGLDARQKELDSQDNDKAA